MAYIAMTQSTCPECLRLVPAKVLSRSGGVWFQKYCPEHGEHQVRIHGDADEYLRAQRYVKPAWNPRTFEGNSDVPCPDGCGFCERHEQHLCMPIIEITSRCDLACPICINSSGGTQGEPDLTVPELQYMLDRLLQAEPQVDVLNLSGGEPLLHPRLIEVVDACLKRPEIVRVSISTNGLQFLERPDLLRELKQRDVVASLQFDGFDDDAYRMLRGRALRREKEEILGLLKQEDVTTSLTMTIAEGVNDAELPHVVAALFGNEHIISLMLQPLAFVGRGSQLSHPVERLSIPDVLRHLERSGIPPVSAEDFVPLPCSHPLCFSLAFYLMLDDGQAVALNRLTDASSMLDAMSNRVVFGLDSGEHEQLKEMIYDLWTGPAGAVPESKAVLRTLKTVLKDLPKASTSCCFDPRKAFSLVERRMKSIFIHAFQDADTFDLARVRRCCQAYPQRDGRLLPACVHNVRGRC